MPYLCGMKTPIVPSGAITLRDWLLVLFLSVTWGCSFIFMKHGLSVFSFAEVAAMRVGISALVFIPLLGWHRAEVPQAKWGFAALIAVCGNGLPAVLFPLAQTHIDSSLAGILNGLTPLWVLVLGALLFAIPLTARRVAGILLGLVGAAALVFFRGHTAIVAATQNNLYGFFIILATGLYGVSSNLIQRFMGGIKPVIGSAMAFAVIGPPCLVYLFSSAVFWQKLTGSPAMWQALLPVVALAVVNTIFGNLAYYALIQRTGAVFASVVTYFVPIVAIGLGVCDGEGVSAVQILGMGFILSGVYLVNDRQKKLTDV